MRCALQIDLASYGQDHPTMARNLSNLAGLLQATNRLTEAEPLMRRALQMYEASLGLDHTKSQIVLGNYRQIFQGRVPLRGVKPEARMP